MEEFETLWREAEPKLKRFIGSKPLSREDKEDLLSDTMLRAFKSFDSFKGDRPFLNWCCRIVERLFIDWKRTARRRVQQVPLEPLIESGWDVVDPKADTSSGLDARVLKDKADAFMSELSRDTQSAMRLIAEGHSIRNAARMAGMNSNTLRSRLHRIRHAA